MRTDRLLKLFQKIEGASERNGMPLRGDHCRRCRESIGCAHWQADETVVIERSLQVGERDDPEVTREMECLVVRDSAEVEEPSEDRWNPEAGGGEHRLRAERREILQDALRGRNDRKLAGSAGLQRLQQGRHARPRKSVEDADGGAKAGRFVRSANFSKTGELPEKVGQCGSAHASSVPDVKQTV